MDFDSPVEQEQYKIEFVIFKQVKELGGAIFKPGTFIRNVFITSSWNVAILAVQVTLSPIITRLYSPEQYGVFSVFSSIVVMVSLLGSLRYNEAIVLAKTPGERNNLASLSIILTGTIACFSLGGIIGYNQISSFFDNNGLRYFVYLIPLGVLLTGLLEVLICINAWKRKFFTNGMAGFMMNLIARIFTIGYGQLSPQPIVLIGGDLLGKIAGCLTIIYSLPKFISKGLAHAKTITYHTLKAVAYQYRHFPYFVFPSSAIQTFSNQLPIYFFQTKYSSAVVGAFALATSLLEIINKLIPYSIAGVFFSQAAYLKNESKQYLSLVTFKLFTALTVAAGIIFFLCAGLSRYVFPFVFGNSWQLAGIFSAILSVSYATNFINTSIVEVYKVIDKQKALLITSTISVFLKIIALGSIMLFDISATESLLIFCVAGALGNWIQVVVIFIKLRYKVWSVIISLSILEAILIPVVYYINMT
ncbi:MAG: oligosaccharide flippase family protein [Bacteroidetes bacterium]|nr:oligosaccharide flippase family protein [Bacteroidota bacterium]